MSAHDRTLVEGRRLPFFTVTTAETSCLAETFAGRRLPIARSVYFAMIELANEARSTTFEKPRKAIAARAGVNVRVVDDYTPELESAGLIHVDRVQIEGVWHASRWTVVGVSGGSDPAPLPRGSDDGGSDPAPLGGGDPAPPLSQEEREEGSETTSPPSDRASAREAVPDDFPPELLTTLDQVEAILERTAKARGQVRPVARGSIAKAMMVPSRRRKPFVEVADKVERWLVHGNGRRRQSRDVVARWVDWLDNTDDTPLRAVDGTRTIRRDPEAERQARQAERLAIARGEIPAV